MPDRYQPMFGTPVAPWHTWFAWHPVPTSDRGWSWLHTVKRRRIQKHGYLPGGIEQWWQYAVDNGR